MKELTPTEIKKIQIDMLEEVKTFCEMHGLNYYLSGGTLLGAVRHKGYIPWDDDIDLMMPRKDYEWFLIHYRNEMYSVHTVELGEERPLAMMFMKNNTKLTDLSGSPYDVAEHLYIDIFPIDNLSNNKVIRNFLCLVKELLIYCYDGALLEYKSTMRYNDRSAGLFSWKRRVRNIVKYIFITFFRHTSSGFWGRLAHQLSKFYAHRDTKWKGVMITQAHHNHGLGELLPAKFFEDKVLLEFESKLYSAPVGYEKYLSSLFGNYMQLPPEEKRISHHDFRVFMEDL
ncbi:LicD family protein [Selenomonas montiformis]|uniref:LicD family protein n=1 Tax=Selenomonas montiformis TaxID=2652285 RepID=UPI0039F54227